MVERSWALGFILKVIPTIFRRAPSMNNRTVLVDDPASGEAVPPPRRRHGSQSLQLNAVQVLRILGLLPAALSVVAFAGLSNWRLPSPHRKRGHPLVYSEATVLLIALLARLWQLSSREICLWLETWSVLAAACGLPPGRVIDPAPFPPPLHNLAAYPFFLPPLLPPLP